MPRLKRSGGFGPQKMFMVMIFAVVGLFLFSQFFVKKAAFEFTVPEDIGATSLMVFKIVIVGTMTYLAFVLSGKAAGGLSKREAFTLALIGLAIWFLWDNFLAPVLQSGTIEELGTNLAQAVLKP